MMETLHPLRRALDEVAGSLQPLSANGTAPDRGGGPQEPLTVREVHMLTLMAQCASNRSIAARAFVSENTVKYHLKNIYAKLGVQSRAQAISAAHRMALI